MPAEETSTHPGLLQSAMFDSPGNPSPSREPLSAWTPATSAPQRSTLACRGGSTASIRRRTRTTPLDRAHKAHFARLAPLAGVVFESFSLGVEAAFLLSSELEAGASLTLGTTADFLPSATYHFGATLALDALATDTYQSSVAYSEMLALAVEADLRWRARRGVPGDLQVRHLSVLPGVGIARGSQLGVGFARAVEPGVRFDLEVEPGEP